jgi:hypothetical protein
MSFCVYSVLMSPYVGSGLATDCSPVQGVLPTAYRIEKLKKWPSPKGCRSIEKEKTQVKLLGGNSGNVMPNIVLKSFRRVTYFPVACLTQTFFNFV